MNRDFFVQSAEILQNPVCPFQVRKSCFVCQGQVVAQSEPRAVMQQFCFVHFLGPLLIC